MALMWYHRVWGAVYSVVNGEVDVPELEGLGAGFGGGGVGGVSVFDWSEQPEEADDDEVVSNGVEGAPDGVVEVEGVADAADDGEVDRVGAVFGLVFALESPEEIQEYGPEGAVSLLSGIWLTQVGDPLGHGAKGGTNGISADRVVGEAGGSGGRR